MEVTTDRSALYAQLTSQNQLSSHAEMVLGAQALQYTQAAGTQFDTTAQTRTSGDSVSISPEATWRLARDVLETEIGQKVKDAFVQARVDLEEAVGLDLSPRGAASRIFDFATGLLGVFREQNPELSEEDLLDQFEQTIRGAVDQGYAEAMEILEGMGIADEARSNAGETMSILHAMFDGFFEDKRAALRGDQERSQGPDQGTAEHEQTPREADVQTPREAA